jgi:phosphopantetheine--protein transferase-like protein
MKYSQAPSQDAALAGLRDTVIWAEPTTPGIFVAAVTDNSTLNENALLACLGKRDSDRASAIHDPVEKRHFIFRRCFQRFFVSEILNWGGALSELTIEHQLDMAPQCLDAPSLRLSFSSSGPTALACASRQHSIGIDIEKQRVIENAVALANRFFTRFEAAGIAAMPIATQSIAFLEHWTAKEAGLKAIGKGIVSGLNSFVLKRQKNNYDIDFIEQFKTTLSWKLDHIALLPDHIVAVVHNIVADVQKSEK